MKSTLFTLLFSLLVISCGKKESIESPKTPVAPVSANQGADTSGVQSLNPNAALFSYIDRSTNQDPDKIVITYELHPSGNTATYTINYPISYLYYLVPNVRKISKVELFYNNNSLISHDLNPTADWNFYPTTASQYYFSYPKNTHLIIVMDDKFEMLN